MPWRIVLTALGAVLPTRSLAAVMAGVGLMAGAVVGCQQLKLPSSAASNPGCAVRVAVVGHTPVTDYPPEVHDEFLVWLIENALE